MQAAQQAGANAPCGVALLLTPGLSFYRLAQGQGLHATIGALQQESVLFSESLDTQWIRLGGWIELPRRIFGRAEIEYDTGDDLEGYRVNLGLGYRL